MEAATPPAEQTAPEQQGQQPAPEQADVTNAEVLEQIRALDQRLSTPQQPEPEQVDDIAGAFAGYGEQPQYEEDPAAGLQEYDDPSLYGPTGEVDPQLAEALQRLDNHEAYLIAQGQKQNDEQIRALGDKYPALKSKEVLDSVMAEIQSLGDELGNPDLAQSPPARLVERVFKSLKADEESASETPAEEAVNQGAALETGAGPGNQAGEPAPEDEYRDAIVAASKSGNNRFTS